MRPRSDLEIGKPLVEKERPMCIPLLGRYQIAAWSFDELEQV